VKGIKLMDVSSNRRRPSKRLDAHEYAQENAEPVLALAA